ncbi:hypothetical protein JTB14_024571 [Gonioctena quinquepunctata]|nr:hypothetical protein JTB14_024571 [Gonioctena quinquepunctata]
MIAHVKKKNFFGILGVLSLCAHVSANENKNGGVVMKIDNGTQGIHPRMMISIHNIEMKEMNRQNTTIAPDSVAKNEATEKYLDPSKSGTDEKSNAKEQTLFFPYNLLIISEILQKLENSECVAATTHVIEAMTRHERWALELFDSFPKFPTGILYGNYYQMGNFDECVGVRDRIETKDESNNTETFLHGQYCLADIHFAQKSGRAQRSLNENKALKMDRNLFNRSVIHWGICLPSACTTKDAEIFTREVFTSSAENFEVVSVVVDPEKCEINGSQPFTILEIVYGCIIGCFIIFTCLATSIHIWYLCKTRRSYIYNVETLREKQSESVLKEIVISFSLVHSIGKIMQTKSHESNLTCICGIKSISMCLIIIGHSLLFIFGGPVENKGFFEEEMTSLQNGPLLNNPLLVDSFLLVSGFLMCRLLLIELDRRKGRVNMAILYVARYIRLTPSYLIVIGLYTTFLYRLGSGPLWKSRIGMERERCLQSWWTNILYVNNYVSADQLCMFQSWYLSVDFHLFIIAPFIIYPLWKYRKVGEIILFTCIAISSAVPFWITYENNLDPTQLVHPPELGDISSNFYFTNAYIKTHMRSSSYFIGILLGYVVHTLQTSGKKIPTSIITFGSILTVSLGLVSMFSIVVFYKPDHLADSLENAIYASLHRIAWCLAVGWIILLCVTDNAEFINKLLSLRPFIPLSRLTYCAYLVNGLVEVYNMGVIRQPMYMSRYELACKVFSHVVFTYVIAFLLCIIFESPIHNVEKILLKRDKSKIKQNPSQRPLESSYNHSSEN